MTTRLIIHVAAHHQSLVAHVIEQCDCSQVDTTVEDVAYAIAKGLRKKHVSHLHTCASLHSEEITDKACWSRLSPLDHSSWC